MFITPEANLGATDLTSSSESTLFEHLINILPYLNAQLQRLGNVLMFSERVYANRKVCEYTVV